MIYKKKLTEELLQDQNSRKEYEALQPEMDITKAILDAVSAQGGSNGAF